MTTEIRSDREALLVELVDEQGLAIGACSVAQAHRQPGQLHRAFSVLLYDPSGRVLLQRRAAVKTRFPQRWSNTCCGHPAPGQDPADAATIRLKEELGLAVTQLTEAGIYRYRAADPRGNQVEHEWDHVLVGAMPDSAPRPDPAEVSEYAWIDTAELLDRLSAEPDSYTPWLRGVLEVAARR
ncbi:isopentenyl-diphosphate Delta-isomerase [Nocardia sp. NBC_00565]|uniref:isopentenyl-diphosphate Delta-isomerase n=1 Tax=Nocardia sp. NBC_00565 TaxID=2975993 RepID=UPI002E7FFCC5|nr:isopentenyl-diphosphate Delta-isomerase [Nocardia sp. NBC_00565]WUC00232.1 isopentenyl-diphosphate Delta-isomerase [Nocardia sp. NBC_00565]